MTENEPYCITFAGPVGCSKTPVAHHLSTTFGWPIFSNDAVRSEVREDTLQTEPDTAEYDARVVGRIKALAAHPADHIYDASQDRHWERYLSNFNGPPPYRFGIISFDLSRDFYLRLLRAKQYDQTMPYADQLLADHAEFMRRHAGTVICSITDDNFSDRLRVAEAAVRRLMDGKAPAFQIQ